MSFFNLLKHRKNSEAGSFIGVTENERALLLRCSFFITADTSVTWDKKREIFFHDATDEAVSSEMSLYRMQ